ncbi:MAG: hypothetical protein J1F20_04645 [Muribaculaceae bacterium]|nr:hypothetical protein [Muribaculaceae bacterium]
MKDVQKIWILSTFILFATWTSSAEEFNDYQNIPDTTYALGSETIKGVIYDFYYIKSSSSHSHVGPHVKVSGCDELGKSLESIVIEDEISKVFDDFPEVKQWPVTSVGAKAFYEVEAREIILNKGLVNGCASYAFYNCPNLKRVVFTGAWLDFMPSNVIEGCHLEQLIIYGRPLFQSILISQNSTVDEIVFPDGATFASYGADQQHYRPTTAIVYGSLQCDGADVNTIVIKSEDDGIAESSNSTFGYYSCPYVQEFRLYVMTPPHCSEYAFQMDPLFTGGVIGDTEQHLSTIRLYVPNAAIEAYKNDAAWGKIKNILPLEDAISENMPNGDEINDCIPEYYNLQGIKIEQPQPGSVVICRQGNRVTKKVW